MIKYSTLYAWKCIDEKFRQRLLSTSADSSAGVSNYLGTRSYLTLAQAAFLQILNLPSVSAILERLLEPFVAQEHKPLESALPARPRRTRSPPEFVVDNVRVFSILTQPKG